MNTAPTRLRKVVITGGAGLVGQNLLVHFRSRPDIKLVAIDKHAANMDILRRLHPDVQAIEADLAEPGPWCEAMDGADCVILNQAQIGGLDADEFERNNVTATRRILDCLRALPAPPFVVHISSSVVNSQAVDFYTESKKRQEALVLASGLACTVLRPTLMFGWFDRKHLGWLARFMAKAPLFPIPGSGRYPRQPLYVGDFCRIILGCIDRAHSGKTFDISGHEFVDYVDMIRIIKTESGARTPILHIPYRLFWIMLYLYGKFDRSPPFTTRQLEALVIPESFPVIDWPRIFAVRATPFREALRETLHHPEFGGIVLRF
jgi:nucleoside-diphosphate-sugar epimerase